MSQEHLDRYTCEEMFRRLDQFMDRELAPDEVELVRKHLETCAVCASEYRFEESVLRQVRDKMRRVAVPPDLMGKILRRLEEAPEE